MRHGLAGQMVKLVGSSIAQSITSDVDGSPAGRILMFVRRVTARRVPVFVALSLFASLTALSGGCAQPRETAVSKVVILGIDGLDWELVDPLLEEGKLPNLAGLVDRGTRADLRSFETEIKSPIVWTTIATGKGPQKHGIADFLVGEGRKPLYNSNGWLSRPVWDILSEKGYTTGVINWMVSWPAQPVNGYNVTDRIVYSPEDGYDPVERATYPEELADELVPHGCPVSSVTDADIAPLLRGDEWKDDPTPAVEGALETLRATYATDETIRNQATYLLDSREQPDFFAVYLNGVDLMCHFFWGPMDPSSVDMQMDPALVETCSEVIPRYYQRMDGIIGDILERIDDESTVILCSDHGFRGPFRSPQGLKLGIWMHGPVGVLVAAGPGISPNAEVSDASVFDITPTVLALFGEPVARDMDGFVMEDLISESRLLEAPVAYIDTYEGGAYASREEGGEDQPVESAVDDEIKERLRSLGYIE
ncbi:MAG: sulfatase-like hydrolase/transferase [Candidatus Eisenbacteria bacterium]|nr:sulfatase-like hydrolase/transferase [Candidatus Eisenbacteria bacterium]